MGWTKKTLGLSTTSMYIKTAWMPGETNLFFCSSDRHSDLLLPYLSRFINNTKKQSITKTQYLITSSLLLSTFSQHHTQKPFQHSTSSHISPKKLQNLNNVFQHKQPRPSWRLRPPTHSTHDRRHPPQLPATGKGTPRRRQSRQESQQTLFFLRQQQQQQQR